MVLELTGVPGVKCWEGVGMNSFVGGEVLGWNDVEMNNYVEGEVLNRDCVD